MQHKTKFEEENTYSYQRVDYQTQNGAYIVVQHYFKRALILNRDSSKAKDITMGRQATAWRYNNKGRDGGKPSQDKTKEKEYKFATQEQMSRGYYGTYNSVKDNIITNVQK